MPRSSLPRLFLTVFGAMTLIVAGDAAGKLLSVQNVHPYFVAWSRFALAALMFAPFSNVTRNDVSAFKNPLIIVRALFIAFGIASILTALQSEPMADVFGAFFIGPVVAFFLSALVLRETITSPRVLFLALGFIGVLCVVKPNLGLSAGLGFALLAGCLHGSYIVTTRAAAPYFKPRLMLLSQLVIGALILAPMGLAHIPTTWSIGIAALVLLSAAGSATGNFLLVMVSKTAPASIIAPLIYTQLIAATGIGYIVFGDWPDHMTLFGLTLILMSGILSLRAART